MKKALILLLLLPFIGFSQTTLVQWKGTNVQPTASVLVANITSANISGNNVNFATQNWGNPNAFHSSAWPTSTTPDYTKYIEFRISANTNYNINLSALNFNYFVDEASGPNKFEVRYSTSSAFTNNGTLITGSTTTTAKQAITEKSINLSGITVNSGQTLYIRLYAYERTNSWDGTLFRLQHSIGGSVGPYITGQVVSSTGVQAIADNITTTEATTVSNFNILGNDTASAGLTINNNSLAVSQPPAGKGTVTVNSDKTINYNPGSFTGSTSFTYTIASTTGGYTATGTVNVTVTPFVGPTANTDTVTLVQNSSIAISVLSNDTFGSTIVVSSLTKTNPTHGTVTVNSNNTITYTPTVGYSGADSFTYTVKDANNKQSTATVNITVTPFASPTANPDTANTGKNIAVTIDALANDIAGSGTISTISLVSTTHGTSTIDSYKRVVYTPTNNYIGAAVVTYTVTNSNGKSTNGTINITVVQTVAPTATNDSATTAKNNAITLNVLSNDVVGANATLKSIEIVTAPANGDVVINADNTITYTPVNGFYGTNTFSYKITNSFNLSSTATVSISVINQPSTGALCGTYTVGNGGNYATITAAVTDLNLKGVQCPVTFLLTNTLYSNATGEAFPIQINQFTGTSATNTVTFKPATGKFVSIEATGDYLKSVFKIVGGDNIVFDGSNATGGTTRNLTVIHKDNQGDSERAIFWIASTTAAGAGATNITIKYTNIKMLNKNNAWAFCAGIYSGGSDNINAASTAVANNNKLTVFSNDFTNVKQGVYVNGNATTPTTNVIVHQNDLGAENNSETIIQPGYFNNVNGFEYTENSIYNLYRDSSGGSLLASGICVEGNSQNGSILKNDIKTLTKTLDEGNYFGGIVLNSSNATSNILVANNFIANVSGYGAGDSAKNGHGIVLAQGGGYKIYHNTVNLITNPTNGGASSALYVAGGVTSCDVKNNVFANNQTGTGLRCAIMITKEAADINNANFVFNYNNLSSSNKFGYIGTNSTWYNDANAGYITTFEAWKTTTNKEANSTNIIPVFATATDLHLDTANAQNTGLNNTGTPLTLVTKDIDGQKRNTATPDMGADEWGVLTLPQPGSNDGIYCDSSTTYSTTLWANGTHWSNGEPTAYKDVIFNGDYVKAGGTFNACSIYVLAGANVNFTTNANVIVQHTLNIATGATFAVESGSNLIQVENDKNAGTAVIKRNSGFLKRLDYTMWSAPVTDARTTGYQSLATFSPFTSASRFYQFITANNIYQSITAITTTKFALGKGYLIRMPNAINGTPNNAYYQGNERISFAGAFQGTPNNGNIKIALEYGAAPTARYNAIGNPYPSPISIKDFLTQNIDVIDATMYFWRKTNDSEQTTYSVINLTGYSANQAPGGTSEDGNLLIKDPYTIDADKGVLNTGQGFIVEAKGAKEVVFRNNMRVKNNSEYFFKTAQDSTSTAENVVTEGRVWLNATNTLGAFSQAIVAYNPATTLDYDNGYDGKALAAGNISLYSVLQTQTDSLHLIIQSRGSFTVNDTVAMGYTAATAGQFDIAIDHKDGVFSTDQAIYLVDTFTGSMRNLADGSYTFTTEAGTFNNRFKVVYALKGELGTDTPVVDAKQLVVYRDGKQINIEAPATIKTVTVFDMLGKNVYTKNNIDNTTFATDSLNVAQQVLIIQITLDNNQVVSKKIMMN
ncbi:Ig-like domain-containing protein [Flavobacterium subsaxonicum]|uniref:Secretion system C-terminal sorting domain-containing protein n=1 Tax=Flavobacterium subsaxonicum WB 4.1-42 = DSM 21790 TaxID=1121898 RepID=A0A0A2MHR3_9FLAO|nr:Ig-like domain-containing protein [Flavobacterium subsaxonicum]KGO91131.1 hypothetical protein Q766_19395 [Flavobacterium subsaxonicum WB 4.1-42 = DSM 21790]